jgi:hypothetical protein
MHMKQAGLATAAALVWMTGALIAQSASPAPQTARAAGGERITVSGCVERADQVTPNAGSTVGTTVSSLDFVLIKARVGEGRSSTTSATGTSGTAASNAATGAASANSVGAMYRLVGDQGTLNPHVGHQVEITGTSDRPINAPAAGPAADPANPTAATAPRLTVQSVKMISQTCPR